MKNLNKIIAMAAMATLAAAAAGPALAQNVGISIGVNQPGMYGRIDIGNAPPPMLVYPQPVIIQQPPQRLPRQPIYLYVPPVQQQNWGRYCNQYSACNQPVYFVQEQWVRERYVQAHPGWRPGHRDDRWDRRDDRRDHRGPPPGRGWDRDHGRGPDHDRGPDRGRHGDRDDRR